MKNDTSIILERLSQIENTLKIQNASKKNILNFDEATYILDISKSYLYKMTSRGDIPHYKPQGKKIYFLKAELEAWLLQHRVKSQDEIERQSNSYINSKN